MWLCNNSPSNRTGDVAPQTQTEGKAPVVGNSYGHMTASRIATPPSSSDGVTSAVNGTPSRHLHWHRPEKSSPDGHYSYSTDRWANDIDPRERARLGDLEITQAAPEKAKCRDELSAGAHRGNG